MKSLCKKEKYFVTLVLLCIVSLMPRGVMCAPPPGAGGGQQICQSGPCVDSVAIIDGQVNTQDLAVGAVGSAQIQADAVDGAKVLDGSLTGVDIQDGSIGSADIGPGAIGTNQLSDGAVTGVKVQAGSITGAHIQDGAVGTADVAPGVIGTAHLSNDSVTGAKVLDGSLTGDDVQDGSIGSGAIATGAVGTAHLSDGAVTAAKVQTGSLTGAHVQDGSIDSTKVGFNFAGSNSKGGPALDLTCVGCVSKSELDFAIPGSAARQIIVAASGGDFTSIQAAINSATPSATNPYVIKVMPGTYVEDVTMKSFMHLEGAGRETTTIQGISSNTSTVVSIVGQVQVRISGFTIKGGFTGLRNEASSMVTIANNTITGNRGGGIGNANTGETAIYGNNITYHVDPGRGGTATGIYIFYSSSVTVQNNYVSNNMYGIYAATSASKVLGNILEGNTSGAITGDASPMSILSNIILGNNSAIGLSNSAGIISGNAITGNNYGIGVSTNSSPAIIGNTITGNKVVGIDVSYGYGPCNPKIIHNIITGNGAGLSYGYDITVNINGNRPNISFNVYDRLLGTDGVGMYNVNSNGDPAPAP